MTAVNMTFLDQQNKLSSLLGDSNTTTDDQWPLADRKFEINRGEVQFGRDSKIALKFATGTIASQALDLPSDWVETYKIAVSTGAAGTKTILTDDREISLNDIERFQNSGSDYYYFWVNASGTKQLIFVSDSSNTKTYHFWYFGRVTTALEADGDTSIFPDEYREASTFYAASELLDQVGKTKLANRYRTKYQFLAEKAEAEYEKHYINKQPPRPDIESEHVFDSNTQGVGSPSQQCGW